MIGGLPLMVGLTTHVRTAIVNGLILAALTAFNVAVAIGIQGLRADPQQFAFALATGAGLAFFEYLAIYQGLKKTALSPEVTS